MRIINGKIAPCLVLIGCLFAILGIGILSEPSISYAQNAASAVPGTAASVRLPVHAPTAFYVAAKQDASQGQTPDSTPPKPKPVDMPDGDGKAIVVAQCQACHRLGNITSAHKSLDDWRDTVEKMIDYGANVPKDKVETIVQYLARNFGPKVDAPAADAQAPSGPATPSTDAAPAEPAKPKPAAGELPEGDGKAIVIANCQACHRLGNITSAHKSLDDWRDTVEKMIDYGANLSKDKEETLVQYLAKNFGPKTEGSDSTAPAGSGPTTAPQ